jgi:hypothetical protein
MTPKALNGGVNHLFYGDNLDILRGKINDETVASFTSTRPSTPSATTTRFTTTSMAMTPHRNRRLSIRGRGMTGREEGYAEIIGNTTRRSRAHASVTKGRAIGARGVFRRRSNAGGHREGDRFAGATEGFVSRGLTRLALRCELGLFRRVNHVLERTEGRLRSILRASAASAFSPCGEYGINGTRGSHLVD